MNISNAAHDRADELAERERQSGIEAATKELSGSGFTHCIDCGAEIDRRRRAAIPSAKRCFPCQQSYERDRVMM